MRVIGLGNPLRGDDAAGLLVARRVRELGLEAIELEGEPIRLLDAWAGAESVALADAARTGAAPGVVSRFDVSSQPLRSGAGAASTHALGLDEVIELGRSLGRLPPRLVVYAIEVERVEAGAGLSPAVESAVEAAAKAIAAEAANALGGISA